MNFEVRNKKALELLQGLSFKSISTSVVSAFVLSSMVSMGIAFFVIPTESKPGRTSVGRARLTMPERGLSKEDLKIILQRNIFNSEGKLGDDDPTATPSKTSNLPTTQLVKSNLPLKVRGIIFSGDPKTGLATLENTQKRRVQSYVVGDIGVNNDNLSEIYEDRVILEVSGRREYIEADLFELVRSRRKKGSRSRGAGRGLSRIATKPPPEAHREDGFERKNNDIKISEEFKRNLLTPDNMAKILQDAKAEPNMVNGELKGFRLTRIRENSVYEKAGFQNNDVVEEINGIPLRDAAGAIRLLQQLKTAKDIEVRISRGGSAFDLNIEIQ